MAETSKNKIYYNDNEDSIADVLEDMKKLAESTDNAIEKAKYNDTELKNKNTAQDKEIAQIKEKNTAQDSLIEELQTKVVNLEAENTSLKNQIPSATASGNSIHIEDSGTLDFDWKINGGHAQAITTQPENYVDDREARGKTILEATSLYLPIINLKAGNGYYFKIFDNNNKIQNDSRYLAAEFYDENKVKIKWGSLGFPHGFTEEVATKVKYAKIYYNGNDTDKVIGNTVIKKIGLKITSSASADDIDMFVPDSPSLNYPSEIETVGSNVNGFDLISYYNSANVTRATAQLLKNGIKLNFKAGADAYIGEVLTQGETLNEKYRAGCVAVKPNTTYTIHVSSAPKCYISYLDENYKAIRNFAQFFGNVTFTTDAHTHYFYFRFGFSNSTSDLTSYEFTNIKIEKGSIATLYSPYGMGSVKIDVVNKNLVETVEREFSKEYSGNYGMAYKSLKKPQMLKANKIYAISLKCKSNKGKRFNKVILKDGNVDNYTWTIYKTIPTTYTIYSTVFKPANDIIVTQLGLQTVEIDTFYFADFLIEEIKEGSTSSDYIEHQSQTAIIPVQQEMLSGDYISSVEHHEWGKIESYNNEEINTEYISTTGELSQGATVYYKLATPVDLELTEEQKAIRDTKLYTYKNVTNISLSDELASIDVNYKKDPTTEHDELQNQIDEIKQLISTPETSALLLDNLQKDVESEVE